VRHIYALLRTQEESLRAGLIGLAKQEEPIRRFETLPGMGWIRGVTFYVYIDAPQRFRSKAALWRYSGSQVPVVRMAESMRKGKPHRDARVLFIMPVKSR
jgi:hypothetical protein